MIAVIKHIGIEGPGTLGDYLVSAGFDLKMVDLANGDSLPRLDRCRAIVSLGGPMSVYDTDKYPFLLKEEDFLKKALAESKPVLGICLGGQILAKISGAAVTKARREEMGWYDLELTPEARYDPLFKNLGLKLLVFQWHEDTFAVPDHGVLLAVGSQCRNQAFRIGDSAWGLQFHLELTKDMIADWLDYYKSDLDRDELLSGYYKRESEYRRQAAAIYDNFFNLIAQRPVV